MEKDQRGQHGQFQAQPGDIPCRWRSGDSIGQPRRPSPPQNTSAANRRNLAALCSIRGMQVRKAIPITAGAAKSRKGRWHNVAKNILLDDLANGLETQKVIVAHDLPPRDRFMQELESSEVETTAAGNTVLDARAMEHHADLAMAAAIGCICRTMPRAP